MESDMPRQKLNWSLERSRIQADRDTRPSLTLTWKSERNSFGDTIYYGRDSDGASHGYVLNVRGAFVAGIYIPGTTDLQKIGEITRKDCVGLRQAQAMVEAHVAGLASAEKVAA
jgi:hypothetical protein